MEKMTFESLGYGNMQPFDLQGNTDRREEDGILMLDDCSSVAKSFLMPTVKRYISRLMLHFNRQETVAAIAYRLDGTVEYALNSPESQTVTGGKLDQEDGTGNRNRIHQIICENRTERLLILQEIPAEQEGLRFLVTGADNPSEGRMEKKRKALVESCVDYLVEFNGRSRFTAREQNELILLMDLLAVFDPEHRVVKKEDERIGNIGRDGNEKGKILSFPAGK